MMEPAVARRSLYRRDCAGRRSEEGLLALATESWKSAFESLKLEEVGEEVEVVI